MVSSTRTVTKSTLCTTVIEDGTVEVSCQHPPFDRALRLLHDLRTLCKRLKEHIQHWRLSTLVKLPVTDSKPMFFATYLTTVSLSVISTATTTTFLHVSRATLSTLLQSSSSGSKTADVHDAHNERRRRIRLRQQWRSPATIVASSSTSPSRSGNTSIAQCVGFSKAGFVWTTFLADSTWRPMH